MAINANSFVTAFRMANSMKNNRQGISSVKLNQIQLNNKKQVIIMSFITVIDFWSSYAAG